MTPEVSMWDNRLMVAIDRNPSSGLNGAIAAELRAERAAQQVTITDLAARSGVSRSTLLRTLNAERAIAVEVLQDVAGALGVGASEIIERAERRAAGTPAVVALSRVTAPGYGERVDLDEAVPAAALDYGDDVEQEAEDQATTP